jgi:hypothetical protein
LTTNLCTEIIKITGINALKPQERSRNFLNVLDRIRFVTTFKIKIFPDIGFLENAFSHSFYPFKKGCRSPV